MKSHTHRDAFGSSPVDLLRARWHCRRCRGGARGREEGKRREGARQRHREKDGASRCTTRAPFKNSAALGRWGGGGGIRGGVPHQPPSPMPLERWGQILIRAFGQSKFFSGAFGPPPPPLKGALSTTVTVLPPLPRAIPSGALE